STVSAVRSRLSTSTRLTGAVPDESLGSAASATGAESGPSASCLDEILRTLQELQQGLTSEQATDSAVPGDLYERLRRLTVELRQGNPSQFSADQETTVSDGLRRIELLASIFEQAQQGVVVLDQAGHILELNDAFLEITAITSSEVVGRPLTSI